jgi:mannose-6-phosphate isomerase-like protein (cupin superfamily)
MRAISMCGLIGWLVFMPIAGAEAADTVSTLLLRIDDILQQNPLPAGAKSQLIPFAESDAITVNVARAIDGAGLKPHLHKTHDETIYVVQGTGQMFVNGAWVDIQPGMIQFNPRGNIHGHRQTGAAPLVFISIFTPPLKEPDRHFVE